MTGKLFTTAAAAIALSVTPALAQQSQFDRAPAPVSQAEMLDDHTGGNGPGLLMGIVALAAVVAAALILAGEEGEDEDLPTSP